MNTTPRQNPKSPFDLRTRFAHNIIDSMLLSTRHQSEITPTGDVRIVEEVRAHPEFFTTAGAPHPVDRGGG